MLLTGKASQCLSQSMHIDFLQHRWNCKLRGPYSPGPNTSLHRHKLSFRSFLKEALSQSHVAFAQIFSLLSLQFVRSIEGRPPLREGVVSGLSNGHNRGFTSSLANIARKRKVSPPSKLKSYQKARTELFEQCRISHGHNVHFLVIRSGFELPLLGCASKIVVMDWKAM